jgi:hypothetical protein
MGLCIQLGLDNPLETYLTRPPNPRSGRVQNQALKGSSGIIAINEGKYPLYELQAYIVDLSYKRGIETVDIGSLAPEAGSDSVNISLDPSSDEFDLLISFRARNGFWHQLYMGRKIEGKWFHAWRINRNSTGGGVQFLEERVDDGFPVNPQGDVDWPTLGRLYR